MTKSSSWPTSATYSPTDASNPRRKCPSPISTPQNLPLEFRPLPNHQYPAITIDHVVPGKILRADLATLIEFLSDTLAIKIEDAEAIGGTGAGDSVLALEDVTRTFNVSSKTIQRWRKEGLIALRYVYPDGRRRLGFLDSAVRQFAHANKEHGPRSATFKQLSDDERHRIIALATTSAAAENHAAAATIKEVSRRIALETNRAADTIRLHHPQIRPRFTRKPPSSPIFPSPRPTSKATPPRAPIFPSSNMPANTRPIPAPLRPPQPLPRTHPQAAKTQILHHPIHAQSPLRSLPTPTISS